MSRVAIVSGGAGALGTAIVRELAGRGHRVASSRATAASTTVAAHPS